MKNVKEYRITKPVDCSTRDFERALQFLKGRYKDVTMMSASNKPVLKLGL